MHRQPERSPAPDAADERDEQHQPDEELRRQDLAQRDERDEGRGGVAEQALGRRRARARSRPRRAPARRPARRPAARRPHPPRAGEVLRAAPRRPLERHADRVVQGEQDARAEALDLERAPELAAERVEDAVRRRGSGREVDREHRGGRERDDDDRLASTRCAARPRSRAAARRTTGYSFTAIPTPTTNAADRSRPVAMSPAAAQTSAAGTRSNRVRITPPRSTGTTATTREHDQPVAPATAQLLRSAQSNARTARAPTSASSATKTAR